MLYLTRIAGVFSRLGVLLVATAILSGCETFESSSSAPPSAANVSADTGGMDILRVNDLVQVFFSGNMSAPKDFNERIKEDGTISPPMITTPEDGPVKAEGKTVGELQK